MIFFHPTVKSLVDRADTLTSQKKVNTLFVTARPRQLGIFFVLYQVCCHSAYAIRELVRIFRLEALQRLRRWPPHFRHLAKKCEMTEMGRSSVLLWIVRDRSGFRVNDPAHEEDRAVAVLADQEQERVIHKELMDHGYGLGHDRC